MRPLQSRVAGVYTRLQLPGAGRGFSLAVLAAIGLSLIEPGEATAQDWNTVTAARALTGEDRVSVEVVYAAGEFELGAAEPGRLYRMALEYDQEQFEPVTEYGAGKLRIGIASRGRGSVKVNKAGSLNLSLTRDVPLDVRLELGAVKADIDLTGLALTNLEVRTGAAESRIHMDRLNSGEMEQASFKIGAADLEVRGVGNLNAEHIGVEAGIGAVTLYLDGDWARNAHLDIEVGLGALNLKIPEGLGVKLSRTSFLTSLDTEGLVRRGDAYYSVNWEAAERRVNIDISAALGSVDVSTIR